MTHLYAILTGFAALSISMMFIVGFSYSIEHFPMFRRTIGLVIILSAILLASYGVGRVLLGLD